MSQAQGDPSEVDTKKALSITGSERHGRPCRDAQRASGPRHPMKSGGAGEEWKVTQNGNRCSVFRVLGNSWDTGHEAEAAKKGTGKPDRGKNEASVVESVMNEQER